MKKVTVVSVLALGLMASTGFAVNCPCSSYPECSVCDDFNETSSPKEEQYKQSGSNIKQGAKQTWQGVEQGADAVGDSVSGAAKGAWQGAKQGWSHDGAPASSDADSADANSNSNGSKSTCK